MANSVQQFLLNDLDVRGAFVHLDSAWQTVLARRSYPEKIAALLGEATVATLLMSTHIKYNGQLILQLQSPADLSLLIVQNDNRHHFRALAQYRGEANAGLKTLADGGLIAIIIEAEKGKEPYQGVVGIDSDRLSDNLETYFNQSEQLQTLLVLRADKTQAAGILLQVMPGADIDEDTWQRLRHLCETLNLEELKTADSETMIKRIFAEDDKTVYPPETAAFQCSCSSARTLAMLANLSEAELQEIVEAGESVSIGCDFCGQSYDHDAATISALLSNKLHPN